MSLHKSLLILAAVQAVLALILWRPDDAAPPGSRDLVSFDGDDIDEITLSTPDERDESGDTVTLRRGDDGWVVASAADYPVDSEKIDELLEKLGELTIAGDAIASQEISHVALDVAESQFGRKVELTAGSEGFTFFAGRSDSGGLNIRRDGEADVHAGRGANLFDLAATASSYVERAIVDVEADRLDQILIENSSGTIILRGLQGQWTPSVVPPGRQVDSAEVDRVVSAATNVRLTEPVADGRFSSPVRVSWTGTDDEGEPFAGGFEIGDEEDAARFVRIQGDDHVVLVSTSTLRTILDATLAGLTTVPEMATP